MIPYDTTERRISGGGSSTAGVATTEALHDREGAQAGQSAGSGAQEAACFIRLKRREHTEQGSFCRGIKCSLHSLIRRKKRTRELSLGWDWTERRAQSRPASIRRQQTAFFHMHDRFSPQPRGYERIAGSGGSRFRFFGLSVFLLSKPQMLRG